MKNHDLFKFKCFINNDKYEYILGYNDIVQRNQESDIVQKYKKIIVHECLLSQNHPNYRGSSYNIKLKWENDEVTSEPLDQFAKDDPVSCAQYALDNDLLSTEGWKRFRHIAKNQKKLKRMVRQAKLRSYKTSPKYMFGIQIQRNYSEALKFD